MFRVFRARQATPILECSWIPFAEARSRLFNGPLRPNQRIQRAFRRPGRVCLRVRSSPERKHSAGIGFYDSDRFELGPDLDPPFVDALSVDVLGRVKSAIRREPFDAPPAQLIVPENPRKRPSTE